MAIKDIRGERFERLVALERAEKRWGVYLWRCICDCGSETTVAGNSLRSGNTKSCGCLSIETVREKATSHGLYGTPAYKSWGSMIQRTTNPKVREYARYGGAGITVCDEWRDFSAFFADMGERPAGTSLDRYPDTAGNYEPGNCRWATPREQRANQQVPVLTLEQAEQIRSLRARTGLGPKGIAEALGLPRGAVSGVLYLGNLSQP